MTRRVISYKYLPVRLPLFQTITLALVLDRLQPPGIVWGIVATLVCLWWVGAAVALAGEVNVLPCDVDK